MSTEPDEGLNAAEGGLVAALAGLSTLIAGARPVEELLIDVANFARQAVPGADGAGVTMLEAGRPDKIAASAPFVRDVDSIQYRLGQGPCISAAATGSITGSGALGEDDSWPAFGPRAAELGVHSAISLPLTVDGEVLGALNVYAHDRDAFDGSSRAVGQLFSGPAAVAVHNARLLDKAQRETARLEAALATRSTIDRAIGIIMSRSGVSEDDAFLRLRIISQQEHTKLHVVATRLVEEAVRRARARKSTAQEGEQ